MDCIVCPSRLYNYFHHLIITFQHELKINSIITDTSQINTLKSKKIILFGAQGLINNLNYSEFLASNKVYLYNTEQLPSTRWDYIINNSIGIEEWWDYSLVNITYLKDKKFSIPTEKVKHIPFCYSSILEIPLVEQPQLVKNVITFFGAHHQRRYDTCITFQNALSNHNIIINYDTSDKLHNTNYNNFVKRNMIYLNIHYYVPSILEIVRIVPLLCQGHLVISERSDDENLDILFSPYLVWLDELYNTDGSINIPKLLNIINNHDNNKLKEQFKSLHFKDILDSSLHQKIEK